MPGRNRRVSTRGGEVEGLAVDSGADSVYGRVFATSMCWRSVSDTSVSRVYVR